MTISLCASPTLKTMSATSEILSGVSDLGQLLHCLLGTVSIPGVLVHECHIIVDFGVEDVSQGSLGFK